ncbi:hypothetical protein F5Y04DRAFT_73854 [Hypomontagnella monticulosa]|nr:hypothetical protein F5Y04DRAFT_73854 [Hypomontagnella monticulosa]
MPENAVGFAFQAEISNTGSLVHLLTGRALKALSDGGVDFYSVAAAVTLGKSFVVRDSLGNTVRSHIMSKGGIQSVLSKALSIGWGHSGLAIEMTSTRAGVNALLLIGALATGSTSYQAAEYFADLLALRGCEADKLPNTDVLKQMIGYLSPFVHDLGFSKVLAHITTTAIRAIRIDDPHDTKTEAYATRHGGASDIAGAINQLMLTSQKGEDIYMITRAMGAWLCAFGSHILGMSVELRLDDRIIWASAGTKGTAIFELGDYGADDSVQSSSGIMLVDVSDPENQTSTIITHPIGEIFDSLMARDPRIDDTIREAIYQAICLISLSMSSVFVVEYTQFHSVRINSKFKAYEALKETLRAFGFKEDRVDSITPIALNHTPNSNIASTLRKGARRLYSFIICDKHSPGVCPEEMGRCLRGYIDRVVFGISLIVTYLMQCRFNADQLEIREDILLEDQEYLGRGRAELMTLGYSQRRMISNIMLVTGNGDAEQLRLGLIEDFENWPSILGLSAGRNTICYTCVLRNDCYDMQGRFLSILPGRASLNGSLRSLLLETQKFPALSTLQAPSLTSLALGSTLMPHHAPSNANIYMDVSLTEKAMMFNFAFGPDRFHTQQLTIAHCIITILGGDILRCSHGDMAAFRVGSNQNLATVGFGCVTEERKRDTDLLELIAVRGNKLEQLLTVGVLSKQRKEYVFQAMSCLKCSIDEAERKRCKYVVMGG